MKSLLLLGLFLIAIVISQHVVECRQGLVDRCLEFGRVAIGNGLLSLSGILVILAAILVGSRMLAGVGILVDVSFSFCISLLVGICLLVVRCRGISLVVSVSGFVLLLCGVVDILQEILVRQVFRDFASVWEGVAAGPLPM